MSVGRNDPCPCGSGEKYKKCCMKNENNKQLMEQRREQFYQNKQDLVEKIGDYLVQQVPIKKYNQLKSNFRDRTEKRIDKDIEESYFTFWLYFFHRFDNGLRGVDWFYEENQMKLTPDERNMMETWIGLEAQFLQAVDQTDEAVIFKDVITGKTFPVSNHEENLARFFPWVSTISLLEPFDGLYYFNGLRFNAAPHNLNNAIEKLEELKKETGGDRLEIVVDYFPELLSALLAPVDKHNESIEVAEYSLTYRLINPTAVADFLRDQPDTRVEEWGENKKEFVWSGNWRIFKDNACPSELKLADAYGNLYLQDDTLIFVGIEEAKQKAMKDLLKKVEHALVLENENKKVIGNYSAKPNSLLVLLDEIVPDYFTFYAQNDLLKEIDEAIPMFDGRSIRELMNMGRESDAIEWLKNLEFSVYRQVMQQFDEVEVTADFNTVRRELNLPLSPFVTGGSHRKTSYQAITIKKDRSNVLEDDIPYLEALGFTPDTVDNFYAADIVRFFKEKVIDKSDATEHKYGNSLYDLRELMEQKTASSWEECDASFWSDVLTDDYIQLNQNYSKTTRADFLSTMRLFLTWLDQVKSTNYAETVDYIKELEKKEY